MCYSWSEPILIYGESKDTGEHMDMLQKDQ